MYTRTMNMGMISVKTAHCSNRDDLGSLVWQVWSLMWKSIGTVVAFVIFCNQEWLSRQTLNGQLNCASASLVYEYDK